MIIVSACLAGIKCNYKGESKPNQKIIDLVKQGKAIPVCPEQLGGLITPRNPAEQKDDKVFTKDGIDVTTQFKRGAEEVLKLAKSCNAKKAILKQRSPSCGSGQIYDGTFSKRIIKGDGVTAALLKKNNILVFSEENFDKNL
ncbi:MAG: DUF523 domain-containing protein [Candidatus Nanoarchaeia archaeon]|nr:DUF523 domain-containing protein [Candidatus Nanoarchaeia archaeon]